MLQSPLLGKTGPLNQLLFQSVVRIVGDVEYEVAYFGGEFWRQGGDHVVIFGLLRRDSTCAELRLYLSEPDVRVDRPEGRCIAAVTAPAPLPSTAIDVSARVVVTNVRAPQTSNYNRTTYITTLYRHYNVLECSDSCARGVRSKVATNHKMK